MKPTKMSGPDNSVNQIPPWSVIEGDIRLTPFYTVEAAKAAVESYIADINANITTFAEARGGYSKVCLWWEKEESVALCCSVYQCQHHTVVGKYLLCVCVLSFP